MTGRTRLRLCQGTVTGLYHRDIVIEPVAVPSARRHGKVVIFLDTNARDHCTRVVQDHLHFPARSLQNHDSPMAGEVPRPVSN